MHERTWHHAPPHYLGEPGAYFVTASTVHKQHIFSSAEKLTLLEDVLLESAEAFGWSLDAWVVFTNHYHFIGRSNSPTSLSEFMRRVHSQTSRIANELDGVYGRQTWHNFWDKHLTFERSYYARLNYVFRNPVKHGVAIRPSAYRWSSARAFERNAPLSFQKQILSFPIDRLTIADDYEPLLVQE